MRCCPVSRRQATNWVPAIPRHRRGAARFGARRVTAHDAILLRGRRIGAPSRGQRSWATTVARITRSVRTLNLGTMFVVPAAHPIIDVPCVARAPGAITGHNDRSPKTRCPQSAVNTRGSGVGTCRRTDAIARRVAARRKHLTLAIARQGSRSWARNSSSTESGKHLAGGV